MPVLLVPHCEVVCLEVAFVLVFLVFGLGLAFNKSLLSFVSEALSSNSVIFAAFSSSVLSRPGTDDSAPVLSTDSGVPGLQLGSQSVVRPTDASPDGMAEIRGEPPSISLTHDSKNIKTTLPCASRLSFCISGVFGENVFGPGFFLRRLYLHISQYKQKQ